VRGARGRRPLETGTEREDEGRGGDGGGVKTQLPNYPTTRSALLRSVQSCPADGDRKAAASMVFAIGVGCLGTWVLGYLRAHPPGGEITSCPKRSI
jgi:hypothetical protein